MSATDVIRSLTSTGVFEGNFPDSIRERSRMALMTSSRWSLAATSLSSFRSVAGRGHRGGSGGPCRH